MRKLYEKFEVTFTLIWIAAYVILFSVADKASEALGIYKIITVPVGLLLALILFVWIKRNDLMKKYGLCRFEGNLKNYLFFIPLLVIMSTNLWNGVTMKVSFGETILHIISMICVGFIEEIIFRGLLFKAIGKNNVIRAFVVTSITFGIGQIVNLINGADFISTCLQMCYAIAIGFLFATIFYKGKSLLPCIIAHCVVNSLSVFAVTGTRKFEIIVAVVMCGVSVTYALWLLRFGHTAKKSTNMFDTDIRA